MKLQPVVFGSSEMPLLGMFTPASGTPMNRAVVIVAPLGHENLLQYRHLRALARILAESGRPVLRYDLPACGDSGGDDRDPGLVAWWIDSVGAAAAKLRELTGVAHVDVVGLRIGATFAAAAAAAGHAINDLVLWAPLPSGNAYLREMRAFHRLAEKTVATRKEAAAVDGQEASGFLLAPTTVNDLKRLDLTQVDVGARRVLLAGRDQPPNGSLVEHLGGQEGVELTTTVLEGLADIGLSWKETPVPYEACESIRDWLATGDPVASSSPELPAAELSMTTNGVRLVETAVVLRPEDPVVGIATLPADATPSDAWVVFVANRYARRIGPNRMYTTFARRWAARGVPSFRIDVRATGDGGGPEQETVANMYSSEGLEDIRLALGHLRRELGARRFLLVGLCSGAFGSYHTALADDSVDGVVLIGVHMLVWDATETTMTLGNNLRHGILRRANWERLARGQVPVGTVISVGLKSAGRSVSRKIAMLLPGEKADPIGNEIRGSLAALSARSCALTFIFPEDDPGLAYLQRYLGPELHGLVDQPSFRVVEVPDTDHTFRPLWSQRVLRETLEDALQAEGYLTPDPPTERAHSPIVPAAYT